MGNTGIEVNSTCLFWKTQYLIFTDLTVFLSKIITTYVNVIRSVFTGSRLREIDTSIGKSETVCGKINLYTKYS